MAQGDRPALDERWGKVHFWMTLVGFHLTFLVQHMLGLEGMPRRVADYFDSDGFTGLNQISTVGAFLLGASTLPFLWNALQTLRGRLGTPAGGDPWGGQTLEWATTSPPPPENFTGPLPPSAPSGRCGTSTTPTPGGARRASRERTGRPGDRGPAGHEARPPVDDRTVPWRVFLVIGLFVLVMGAIYWGTAYEESGTVMLLIAAVLSLWIGAYLWLLHAETGPEAAAPRPRAAAAGEALPGHGGRGGGALPAPRQRVAARHRTGRRDRRQRAGARPGVIVPGAVLMALGIGGFVRQTRRRD